MPEAEEEGAPDPESTVRPLRRGFTVLRAMSRPGRERMRPGDLVRATGLPRSTVDRIITTLDRIGYLRFDGQEAALAPPLMELGNAYLSAGGLSDALAGPVAQLADDFDESVSLAVPDGTDVRFIAQATRRRTMSLAFRIGDALPAERCAPGALFAAGWDDDRWQAWRTRKAADPLDEGFPAVPPDHGHRAEADFRRRAEEARTVRWSLDDQLIEPGLVAVCVPVRGVGGRTECALSVVSHTSRHDARQLAERFLPRLTGAAADLERLLAAGRRGSARVPPQGYGAFPSARGSTAGAAAKKELGSEFLESLARGLAVMTALGQAYGEGLALSALAASTGLPRATARRSLRTLEAMGYVRCAGRLFRPLPRILELGYPYLSGLSFPDMIQPHLRQLVDRVAQSASVTVLDGADIRYVARVHTIRVMSVSITVGTRFPAYATAMGRVLLAGLPDGERAQVLETGRPRALTPRTVTSLPALSAILDETAAADHAVIDGELEDGLRSVAVPLRAADGRVVAALNVAQHAGSEPTEETRGTLLPQLLRTAAAIEADLRTASRHHAVRTT